MGLPTKQGGDLVLGCNQTKMNLVHHLKYGDRTMVQYFINIIIGEDASLRITVWKGVWREFHFHESVIVSVLSNRLAH